ncbi:hypothetical protein SORBI_3002G365200 [Sorghum bicolor]|uniref:Uncharacterized protein n=1 Tax=Sorghum bicolor TaxID=4558 RepID=A0A1B6QFC3_SORBI|nr:hypothetical protein SORBI_3002G365200 [Sorghum bicolor]
MRTRWPALPRSNFGMSGLKSGEKVFSFRPHVSKSNSRRRKISHLVSTSYPNQTLPKCFALFHFHRINSIPSPFALGNKIVGKSLFYSI